MGYTKRIWASCDMNQLRAELMKETNESINAKDLKFAKKMKDKGYNFEDTSLVCNITLEEYNNL
jgi:flagellar motor switch protein FliG